MRSKKPSLIVRIPSSKYLFIAAGAIMIVGGGLLTLHPIQQSSLFKPIIAQSISREANTPSNQDPLQSNVNTALQPMTPQVSTNSDGSKTFQGHGFAFNVGGRDYSGATSNITTNGNTIYVDNNGQGLLANQQIQIFSKSAAQTLEQAIIQHFFNGNLPSDCTIFIAPSNQLPSGEQYVEIRTGTVNSDCPAAYVTMENGRYFIASTKQPTEFLFIEAGQSPTAYNGVPWDKSITF